MSCSPSLSCVVHACRSREVTRARRGDVAQANRRDSARYIHRGRCASLEIISRPSARVNRIFRLRFLLFLLPLGASRHLLIVSRVDSSRSTTILDGELAEILKGDGLAERTIFILSTMHQGFHLPARR